MLKLFSNTILKLFGWRVKITLPEERKFVLIVAPHTSNWDFPLGLLASWTITPRISWVAKIQMFRGPLHYLFTALGGIPVDRSAPHGFIDQIADKIKHSENIILTLAPEGTRSKTDCWKTGFYYIALKADIPICFGYIDYQNRTVGFAEKIMPTGDIEKDFSLIKLFYQDIEAKHPEKKSTMQIKKNA